MRHQIKHRCTFFMLHERYLSHLSLCLLRDPCVYFTTYYYYKSQFTLISSKRRNVRTDGQHSWKICFDNMNSLFTQHNTVKVMMWRFDFHNRYFMACWCLTQYSNIIYCMPEKPLLVFTRYNTNIKTRCGGLSIIMRLFQISWGMSLSRIGVTI